MGGGRKGKGKGDLNECVGGEREVKECVGGRGEGDLKEVLGRGRS